MLTCGQGCSEGNDRIALTRKRYLKGGSLIDLSHEITTTGLGHHAQRRALKSGYNLNARVIEGWALGIGKTDATPILDMGISSTDNTALNGNGFVG